MFDNEITPDYHQIIATYLEINDILLTDEIAHLIDIILLQQYDHLMTLHGQGYIRYYFDQYIKGILSLEQFMTLGDIEDTIEDQINPHRYREDYPATLLAAQHIQYPDDGKTLFIVDPLFAIQLTPPKSVNLIQLSYMNTYSTSLV